MGQALAGLLSLAKASVNDSDAQAQQPSRIAHEERGDVHKGVEQMNGKSSNGKKSKRRGIASSSPMHAAVQRSTAKLALSSVRGFKYVPRVGQSLLPHQSYTVLLHQVEQQSPVRLLQRMGPHGRCFKSQMLDEYTRLQ